MGLIPGLETKISKCRLVSPKNFIWGAGSSSLGNGQFRKPADIRELLLGRLSEQRSFLAFADPQPHQWALLPISPPPLSRATVITLTEGEPQSKCNISQAPTVPRAVCQARAGTAHFMPSTHGWGRSTVRLSYGSQLPMPYWHYSLDCFTLGFKSRSVWLERLSPFSETSLYGCSGPVCLRVCLWLLGSSSFSSHHHSLGMKWALWREGDSCQNPGICPEIAFNLT